MTRVNGSCRRRIITRGPDVDPEIAARNETRRRNFVRELSRARHAAEDQAQRRMFWAGFFTATALCVAATLAMEVLT